MAASKIKHKVTGLSVSRKGNTFTAKWKVPSTLKSGVKGKSLKATGLKVTMKAGSTRKSGSKSAGSTSITSYFGTGGTKNPKNYFDRAKWYPVTGKKLGSVAFEVVGTNGKKRGPKASKSLVFRKPAAPKLAVPELETATGNVTCAVTLSETSTSAQERYDVAYKTTVTRGTDDGMAGIPVTVTSKAGGSGGTSTKCTLTYTGSDLQGLRRDEWVKIAFDAWARGLAGDSAHAKASKVVAWAATPVVKQVTQDEGNGIVLVELEKLKTDYHPATKLQLQYVHSESDVVGNVNESEWQDVSGATANADETALSCRWDAVSTAETGVYTFVRVKCTADFEHMYSTSEPVWLNRMYVSPAGSGTSAAEDIRVWSVEAASDADALIARVAWNDSTYNGTEVSWSDDSDGWHSNEDPKSVSMPDVSWDDGPLYVTTADKTPAQGKTYWVKDGGTWKGTAGGSMLTWAGAPNHIEAQTVQGGTATVYFDSVRATVEAAGEAGQVSLLVGTAGILVVATSVFYSGGTFQTGGSMAWDGSALTASYPGGITADVTASAKLHGRWDGVEWMDAYGGSAWVKLTGLSEATAYWVKARRYLTSDDDRGTGWSQTAMGTTGAAKPGVSLSVPDVTAQGEPLHVEWTVGGEQESWRVYIDGAVAASGSGTARSCDVQPSALVDADGDFKRAVTVNVSVTVAGQVWWYAEEETGGIVATIAVRPSVSVSCGRVVTAKPHAFGVSGRAGVEVACRLVACGCTEAMPDSDDGQQYAGEVVWSAEAVIGNGGVAEMEVPSEAHLIDGAQYWLEAVPSAEGLTGETARPSWQVTETGEDGTEEAYETDRLTVTWAHQAVAPSVSATAIVADAEALSAAVTVAAPDGYFPTTDTEPEDGTVYYELSGGSFVQVANPTAEGMAGYWEKAGFADGDGAVDTDVCDVYRSTPDGHVLIAEGVAFGSTVTDRWAPWGPSPSYRLCTRTADGDRDWFDYAYALEGPSARVDFADEAVELTRGVSKSHKASKDYEDVKYLDGTVEGSWGAGSTLSETIAASVIDGRDDAAIAALHDLEQHTGAAFVRTWDGMAYQADVAVEWASRSAASPVSGVTLTASAMECADYVASEADVTGGES